MDGEHAEYNIQSGVQHRTVGDSYRRIASVSKIRHTEIGWELKKESIECRP